MSMFFFRKLDKRTATRLAAIKIRARGLSRCGGIHETKVIPRERMADLARRAGAV